MNKNLFLSYKVTLLLLLSVSCFNISCQETNDKKKESSIKTQSIDSTLLLETDDEMSFLFMGDFMQHSPQIKAAKDSIGNYNYEHYFILQRYFILQYLCSCNPASKQVYLLHILH